MAKRKYKKHIIIFNTGGVINATTPKKWARGHQNLFPDMDFSDSKNTPTVKIIEDYLIEKLNFRKMSNDEMVICYDYKAI